MSPSVFTNAPLLNAAAMPVAPAEKLFSWALASSTRRFDDIYNFVSELRTLAEAFRRVSRARGANTPGVDGITCRHIKAAGLEPFLSDIRSALRSGAFSPSPLREVKITTNEGKTRALRIPTVRDRVVQCALAIIVGAIYEATFFSFSFGYRPARSARHLVQEVTSTLEQRTTSSIYFVKLDIRAFFPSVDHDLLLEQLGRRVTDKRALRLVRRLIQAKVQTADRRVEPTRTGLAQGSPLSPLLANIILHRLDEHLDEQSRDVARLGVRLVPFRYADDVLLLVFGSTHAETFGLVSGVRSFLREQLRLELSPEKTSVVPTSSGAEMLGFNVSTEDVARGVLLTPSHQNRLRLHAAVSRLVEAISHQQDERFFREHLYRLLLAWLNYFDLAPNAEAIVEEEERRALLDWLAKDPFLPLDDVLAKVEGMG